MAQRRTRTPARKAAPTVRLRPADLVGGEQGALWTTAMQRADGDRSRIAILSPSDVRIR